MRKYTCIVMALGILAASFHAFDSGAQTSGKPGQVIPPPIIIIKQPVPEKGKKKAPSNQRVEFVYSPVSHTGTFDIINACQTIYFISVPILGEDIPGLSGLSDPTNQKQ